jgi:ribonucleotide monophosphatase NagD (HAD superfamily)
MLSGPVAEGHAILHRLVDQDFPCYGLTNWSGETYRAAQDLMPFVRHMKYTAVSGDLKMGKPEPEIFQHLLEVIGKPAEVCAFHRRLSRQHRRRQAARHPRRAVQERRERHGRAAAIGTAGLRGRTAIQHESCDSEMLEPALRQNNLRAIAVQHLHALPRHNLANLGDRDIA